MSAPQFGEWFSNIVASVDNPVKRGMYVRTVRRRGNMNRGIFYELTDGNGRFWETPFESLVPVDDAVSHESELEDLRKTLAEVRAQRDEWQEIAASYRHRLQSLGVGLSRISS